MSAEDKGTSHKSESNSCKLAEKNIEQKLTKNCSIGFKHSLTFSLISKKDKDVNKHERDYPTLHLDTNQSKGT